MWRFFFPRKRKRKTIYIASPMTGIPDLNEHRLNEYEKKWRDAGWDVINPIRFFRRGHIPAVLIAWEVSVKKMMEAKFFTILPECKNYPMSFSHTELVIARLTGRKIVDPDSPYKPKELKQ
jgi:hypothetical protein